MAEPYFFFFYVFVHGCIVAVLVLGHAQDVVGDLGLGIQGLFPAGILGCWGEALTLSKPRA